MNYKFKFGAVVIEKIHPTEWRTYTIIDVNTDVYTLLHKYTNFSYYTTCSIINKDYRIK